jgi:hypothetical protein
METSGKRIHLREKPEENQLLAGSLWLLAKHPADLILAKGQELRTNGLIPQKAHRLSAWGVLGSDDRWATVSLLTLLLSGVLVQ